MTINNSIDADTKELVSNVLVLKEKQKQNELDIAENKKHIKENDAKMESIQAPFLKKIKEALAPYKKIEDALDKQEKILENKTWELKEKVAEAERKILLTQAKNRDRFDVPSFTAYLQGLNIHRMYSEEITEKKPLVNGIQIFRVFDDRDFTAWFFLYNTKLVGYSFRRAGEHQGDTTYPYSFFAPCKNVEKVFKVEKPNKWSNTPFLVNATFSEFAEEIETKDPEKLKEIDLSDADVLEIIKNHKGLY